MVTLRDTVSRARPRGEADEAGARAVGEAELELGIFTLRETMLTIRPKPRAIMPSTVSRIISMWHSIMVSSASIQSSRVQVRKSPGRRPSALLTRISGCGTGGEHRGAPLRRRDVGGERR